MTDPDLRGIRRDDRLLDRLGRGAPATGDDAEAMLAAWRRTLPAAGPPDAALLATVTRASARPRRRVARASLGIAASVALVTGGITVAAADAGPHSPLWPVTRLVYGGVAESRLALDNANQAVSGARTAARQGHFPEAARLLTAADQLADKVTEPGAEQQLRAAIATVRDRLPDQRTPTAKPHAPNPTESLGVDPPPLGDDHDAPGVGPGQPGDDHPRPGNAGDDIDDDGPHYDGDDDGPDGVHLPKGKARKQQHVVLPPLPDAPL